LAAPVEVGTRLSAAERPVEQVLVRGVGVHGRHQAVMDADRLVQHLGDRRQAVGRARRVGDDVVAVRVVDVLEVDADHDRRVERLGALAGRGDDHLVSARCEVLGGRRARAVAAGGLDHDVHAKLAPGQLCQLGLSQRTDRMPVDQELAVAQLHGAREVPVDGVVAQQVRQRGAVGDVVHRDDLERGLLLVRGAQDAASDSAEAIDCYAGGHL
jgi:hypothetical protein